MSPYNRAIAFAVMCLFLLPLRAEEPPAENAYRLVFKDENGAALAEARFITPEFTAKKHGPLKVFAEIRLLKNKSAKKGAGWLERVLKVGKKVEIEIQTISYKTTEGDTVADTHIDFNPGTFDANIGAEYSHDSLRKERSWSYGIAAGGFRGGTVTFERIRIAEQGGARQPATAPKAKPKSKEKPKPESKGRSQ
jgi:hypothetical protein